MAVLPGLPPALNGTSPIRTRCGSALTAAFNVDGLNLIQFQAVPSLVREWIHANRLCDRFGLRALCFVLPPAPTIVLATRPTGIAGLGTPTALRKKEPVVPEVVVRNVDIGRNLARYEATLGLIAQHRDKLGAIVGFFAEWLVRDDDRGSRQCGRPNAIDHILRDG